MRALKTRRRMLALIGALPLIVPRAQGQVLVSQAFASQLVPSQFVPNQDIGGQNAQDYPLRADDGGPLENFRIPAELDPATLPGILWIGPKSASVVLYEWFDYNCGYCRSAALELDVMLKRDAGLRLGLLNNAILSLGSIQAAKVQQGLLRLHGPAAAYDFHMRMFKKHGQSDGASALNIVADIGLDAKKVEDSANSQSVSEALTRQARLAQSLGLAMTPSFAIAGVGILGWPGAKSLQSVIANARKCDHPLCD